MSLNTKAPTVSVIIPTYNRAKVISRAIDSVINQTYKNWELLIVDDGSTDDTFQILQENYLDRDKVRYYQRPENQPKGANTCRNIGIEKAKGEFIALLDSDDEWKKDMISKHISCYPDTESTGRIQFSKLIMNNGKEQKIFPQSIYQSDENFSEYLFCRHGLASTITLFMSSEIARRLKFDSGLIKHQDYDFVLRAHREGVKFHMIDKALAIWHCDKRKDRMGQKINYEYSFEWLIKNMDLFTDKSARAFISRDIISHVTKDKDTGRATRFLIRLYREKFISLNSFIFYLIKLFIFTSKRFLIESKFILVGPLS